MKRTRRIRFEMFALAALMSGTAAQWAAAVEFPYRREMLLDADPLPGTRRVPVLEVDASGAAMVDLWCNSVRAQFVVAADTVTIIAGAKTDRQCTAAQTRADDDMLATLEQVTHWRRAGDILTLRGGKTLRFRIATN